MKSENKYQTLKRTLGVLASPITGSLSQQVREEIFGFKDPSVKKIPKAYNLHWTEKFSGISSLVSNLAMPLSIYTANPESTFSKIYLGYKATETMWRALDFYFLGTSCKNTFGGSLEGTLLSKLAIEPFLKKEEKE
jgi:hypothetical protein